MKDRFVKFVGEKILVVGSHVDTSDCVTISVTDADWPAAGSPGWWVNDNGTIRKPTQAEKDQRIVDAEAANKAAAESELYYSCLAYQNDRIDTNMSAEMTKAESLEEAGLANDTDLPKAKACRDWLLSLWGEYYVRKADALNASLDFTSFDPVPHSFTELREERKTFLAGQ